MTSRLCGAVAVVVFGLFVAACGGTVAVEGQAPTPTAASASPTPANEPLLFAVKGDFGAASSPQREITTQMCAIREFTPFDVVATVGDNFYDEGQATRANYTEPERCLYEREGHVWRASWGNHDQADDTRRILGARRWYKWSSKGVDFFVLDSTQAASEKQRAWLLKGLEASTALVKIAYFHHPAFTVGSQHRPSPTIQEKWVPLFERHGVRMVFAGHNHVYEHFYVNGIDYVTTGGGGALLYRCEGSHAALKTCIRAYHFLLVEIDGERIEVRAIDREGDVLDRFVSVPE